MDGTFPGVAPMCPNTSNFTASDPKGKEEPFGWVKEQCTPALYPFRSGRVYERCSRRDGAPQRPQLLFLAIQRACRNGRTRTTRIIPGTSFQNGMAPGQRVALEEFAKRLHQRRLQMMGEIGLQYEGISPSGSLCRCLLRARRGTRYSRGGAYGHWRIRTRKRGDCQNSVAPWGTPFCSRNSWRATRNCEFK